MADENNEMLPASTQAVTAFDIAAAVSTMVPWLGGLVSVVLSNMSLNRKLGRIGEVLNDVAHRVEHLEVDESTKLVATDDFQELLEKALRQVADERSEEKRKMYAAFLAGAIQSPEEPYDEQIRFLTTLETLQPDHIRLLKALRLEPDPDRGALTSTVRDTLHRRLPDMSPDRTDDLVEQINDMRLANLTNLDGMLSPQAAAELRVAFTPYGLRFIKYIESS
jgi:hypothetical protein